PIDADDSVNCRPVISSSAPPIMHGAVETNTLDKNLQQPPMTTLSGRRLLFVMAARAEYGPHLQQRFIPLLTGIGPVEAAVQLTTALTTLAARGELPDLVVSLG